MYKYHKFVFRLGRFEFAASAGFGGAFGLGAEVTVDRYGGGLTLDAGLLFLSASVVNEVAIAKAMNASIASTPPHC